MRRFLSDFRGVEKGDVLMVKSEYLDNETGKIRTWWWYGIVESKKITVANCRRLGAPEAYPNKMARCHMDDVHFLEPEEWPDGVIALRTSLILRGDIDID